MPQEAKIFYDESGQRRSSGHFRAFEPYVIPIARDKTEYKDVTKFLGSMGE